MPRQLQDDGPDRRRTGEDGRVNEHPGASSVDSRKSARARVLYPAPWYRGTEPVCASKIGYGKVRRSGEVNATPDVRVSEVRVDKIRVYGPIDAISPRRSWRLAAR